MSSPITRFPQGNDHVAFPRRFEGGSVCPSCGGASPGKTFAPSNSLLLKLLLGWLFDLPNFPDGLFFVEVSEADIDHQEYSLTLSTLNTYYGRVCSACLKRSAQPGTSKLFGEGKPRPQEAGVIPPELMSPSKSAAQSHGIDQTQVSTPSKNVLQGSASKQTEKWC